VISDEIMCGLGRHGKGTIFVSEALGLDVDAVTFGKAVAAGLYPLSGAVMRRGAH
jgi:4-aminobutyrate aminotransferase-like enzyme